MLAGARRAALAAALAALVALPVACGFPDFGGFGQSTSSGGAQGGASSTSGTQGNGAGGNGPSGCTGDADCRDDPSGKICDTKTHHCVECTPDEDTCSAGNYCAASDMCVPGCNADFQCNPAGTAGGLTCDKHNHLCLGCSTDDQCLPGLICDVPTTTCLPGCTPTHDCEKGHACCGTTCADLSADVMHCGGCDTPCAPANGTGLCVDSKCTIDTCNTGFHDCDSDPSNGCESDAANDPDHCGTCAHGCPKPAGGEAACQNSMCTLGACDPHFGDCDGDPSNGCEANTNTDPKNCGGCGMPCSNNHGTPSCAGGVCAIACDAGFKDCDGDVTNGCEVDTTSNVNNCNTCGNICPPQGGTPACVNSACTVSMCAAGKGDCDGNSGNGCETNLTNDPQNCGGCGLPCTPQNATGACSASACRIGSCNTGFADCDGQYSTGCEVNTQTSTGNCGSCGNACTNGHGTTSCKVGACTPVCSAGFNDCDSDPDNGCETNLNTDPLNCGMCGKKCTFANGSGACQAGTCVLTGCNAGFADCDLNPVNGCEVALNTTSNCGVCGRQCTNANGTTACVGGVCTPACSANFASCDGNPNNGCETNTGTDLANCGSCNAACSMANGTASCSGGNCSIACTSPFKDCNNNPRTDGCEANTNSDANHCGNCTTVCSGGTPYCVGGMCNATPCTAGRSNCDGNSSTGPNGCECATSGCCGTGCQDVHSDGLGQNFNDCTTVGTINDAQAVEAAHAWNAGTVEELECQFTNSLGGHGSQQYFEYVACIDTGTQCACWAYLDDCTGFHPCPASQAYTGAGHVQLSADPPPSTNPGCQCPGDATPPAWN
jgi:hypothetical protein